MIKLLSALLFTLLCNLLQSQPVIKAPFIPVTGQPYHVNVKTYAYPAGNYLWANGPNVYWDFGFLNHGFETLTTETYIDASLSPLSDSFPQATYCKTYFNGDDSVYRYYLANADSFAYLGYYASHPKYYLILHQLDALTDIKYPVTYLDSFEDWGNYYFTGFDKIKSWGQDSSIAFDTSFAKIKCDGYGTLKLGKKVIDSVIRIRVERTSVKTVYIDWGTTLIDKDTTIKTTLYWINNKYNRPVLTVTGNRPFGRSANMDFTFDADLFLGTENPVIDNISIYPVPAYDCFYINTKDYLKNPAIKITDITGCEVASHKLNSRIDNHIPTSDLPPGIYFLQFYDGEEYIRTKKIMKE